MKGHPVGTLVREDHPVDDHFPGSSVWLRIVRWVPRVGSHGGWLCVTSAAPGNVLCEEWDGDLREGEKFEDMPVVGAIPGSDAERARVAEPTDLDPCYGNPVEQCTNPGHGRGPTAPTAEEEAIGDLRDHLGLPKHTPPSIVVAEAHMRAMPPTLVEVPPLRPDFVGADAKYHEAVTSGLAQAVWISSADGAVWVTEDGDVAAKSRYSGAYVSEWHGEAIISAHRWREDEMPVARGETVSGKRAENAPHGTLLVRCDEKGSVLAGQSVICTDGGFTGSSVLLYRVLDLPGGDEA